MDRVLIVDDEAAIRLTYRLALSSAGYDVLEAPNGLVAVAILETETVDAVVSDVTMPVMNGIELLRAVRKRDPHLPLILITGDTAIETAVAAIEVGVFRYIVKPVGATKLIEELGSAIREGRSKRLQHQIYELYAAEGGWVADGPLLAHRFEQAMRTMWVAFQPIVSWRERRIYGYEALLRTNESTLAQPMDFIRAAKTLKRMTELGSAIRAHVAQEIANAPKGTRVLINVDPTEIEAGDLLSPSAPLASSAERVVLEITESAQVEHLKDFEDRIKQLRGLGYQIAVDDFGSGHSNMNRVLDVHPEVIKLDMKIVRGVDKDVRRQRVVRSMLDVAGPQTSVICEGVEYASERDALSRLGCDLFQGYLFARPGAAFPAAAFEGM